MADTSPKPKTREELEKEWWDRWRAEDYSWEGLAEKKIEYDGGVNGEKTLQDYWRRDPRTGAIRSDIELRNSRELIPEPGTGRWFHVAHVPIMWENKQPAKSGWDEISRNLLFSLIAQRLIASSGLNNFSSDGKVFDGRAQFRGSIFDRGCFIFPFFGPDREFYMTCLDTYFFNIISNTIHFGIASSFERCMFDGESMFAWTKFSSSVDFRNSIFLDDSCFNNAKFNGLSCFYNVIFLSSSDFVAAKFSGTAHFRGANFHAKSNFFGSTFSDNAEFSGARFYGETIFSNVVFKSLCQFNVNTILDVSKNTNVEFRGNALFRLSKFEGDADFGGATFLSEANFWNAKFVGMAFFHGVQYCGKMIFESARFSSLASFREISWPKRAIDWHRAFDAAVFSDVFQLHGSKPAAFGAFDSVMLEKRIAIESLSVEYGSAEDTFRSELKGAVSAAEIDVNVSGLTFLRAKRLRLGELERGCRVLKQAMGTQSDKSAEHMFYRFELMARRAGLPWYATEKWVSYFYEATSNFGHSILRPWFWLIVSILFFGLIYRIIGLSFNVAIVGDNSGYAEAFELSFARAFQPLSFWSDSLVGGNLLGQQLVVNPASKWSAVVMYILGTLQSLISIILLFLSGLALRRRFQIN